MEALKVVWGQFLKDVDKLPGWIPLLVSVLLGLQWFGLPEKIEFRGWTVPASTEIVAGAITFVLYHLGDAIDERVFKKWSGDKIITKPRYEDTYAPDRGKAQLALGVGESGMYALASQLIAAAEKERGTKLVYFYNEFAKFLRGLIVPLGILGIFCLFNRNIVVGVLLLVSSAVALTVYPWLKVLHIRLLYRSAAGLAAKKRFTSKETNGVKMYFWDGKYIIAALVGPPPGEPAK
jgi:hypothetical protein